MARIIDVIDHPVVAEEELAYREPQQGSGDFRMGSQVIVSESQAAVFVRGGQALDVLGPGRHTLSTANLPILSGLIGLATSGRNPFTADVYFVNLRDMPQVGWGTNPPIPLMTPGIGVGAVLLITHGVIDIGIEDAALFVRQYAMNRPITRLSDLRERIQSMVISELAEMVMMSGAQSVMDVNKLLSNLEGGMMAKLSQKFASLGMRLKAFEAKPFSAKENVSLDELRSYVSLETIERLKRLDIAQSAAENPGLGGGLASAGVGLGVGQALGATMNPEMAEMQRQMAQQQMMLQQMMLNMMQNQNKGDAGTAPAASAPTASAPQTREEIMALLDALDVKLASGELSEAAYNRLVEKWQQRLQELGGS